MTSERVTKLHHDTFESLRHLDADDNEFWLARQLAKVLDYSEYRHFLPVIERAREACHNSGQAIADHYEDVLEMVDIGSGTQRELPDVRLSRDPCYLIVQNGDPSKLVIANGQTYFVRLPVSPLQPVRLELVEGQCVVRQAHHERSRQAHHERSRQAHHERSRQAHHERSRQAHHERSRPVHHERSRPVHHERSRPVHHERGRGQAVPPLQPVRPELVEGQFMVRQAHLERGKPVHHERGWAADQRRAVDQLRWQA